MKHAKEFSSPDQLKKYLHEHPGADPSKHHVRKEDGGLGSGSVRVKTKVDKGVAEEISSVWKNKPSSNAVDDVRKMIEEDREISVNMLGRAVRVLRNEMGNVSGEKRQKLKSLHDKLKGEMHKEANSRIAARVCSRFAASCL